MGGLNGVDLEGFKKHYGNDPLYHWIGFDSSLMFAAHKAAGGMTSLYRQLGIGIERLFRHILMDSFGLTESEANWNYTYTKSNGTQATRYLDGMLDYSIISSKGVRDPQIVVDWVNEARKHLGIEIPIKGAVFEVREGYKSADSKRQNADLDNLSQALKRGYLMTMTIMSLQVNQTVRSRYQDGGLLVLIGDVSSNNPLQSSYAFLHDIAGYDLVAFFERNTNEIRSETSRILESLLSDSQ